MWPVIPLWSFVAVAVPLVLTPGASTAVVLRNSLAGGTRAGVATAIGANAGSICYGMLSAFGMALALQRWPGAWVLLRTAGVLYLAYLGIQSVRAAVGARAPEATRGEPASEAASGRVDRMLGHVREGFVTNVLNPAIATFYFIVVPQFVPRGAPVALSVLILTAIHVALAASWHIVWAAAGGTLAHTLGRGRPRQILELVAGVALLVLSLKIAIG